jgi:integrase
VDPTTPIGSWKTAWILAKKKAGVTARFHDLRHTAVSRLLERGVPLSVVASIMGWSASTMTKMAKRYAHFTLEAQRKAVETLDVVPPEKASSDATNERLH